MSISSLFDSVTSRINTEYVILVVFLSFSTYFFVESYSLSRRANVFPRLTAGFTIVGTLLLLFRNYLPEPLRRVTAESTNITESLTADEDTDRAMAAQERRADRPTGTDRPIPDAVFTGALVVSYVTLGYLLGLLWMTPLFVAGYTLWFGFRWYAVVLMSLVGFGIAYVFNSLLILSLDEGILTGAVILYG
jgi:hypothetical protein